MAQPTAVDITPSTTQVLINGLQTPYTPVYLPQVNYAGQLVTILTQLSTPSILTSPLLVSTTSSTTFLDGTLSTLIQQPQGFLTVQGTLPNDWAILNSYPFRDQYLSAGIFTFETSTLFTSVGSTIQERTSSVVVENLVVSGSFLQSSGLILATNVSSFGTVTLLSSLTVYGATSFSTHLSTLGSAVFASTVFVGQSVFSESQVETQSRMFVSSATSVGGFLSSPSVRLGSGLIGSQIQTLSTTQTSVNLAGSLTIGGIVSTLSTVRIGGRVELNELRVRGGLSTLSSLTVGAPLRIDQLFQVDGNMSIGRAFGVGDTLQVGGALTILSTLEGLSTLSIQDRVQILKDLSTTVLSSGTLLVAQDLTVISSLGVSTPFLTLTGSFGIGSLTSKSTTIGGSVSTTASFVGRGAVQIGGLVTVGQTVSSLTTAVVERDVSVVNGITVGTGLAISTSLLATGGLDVFSTSVWGNPPWMSTGVRGLLKVEDSFFVTDTAVLSSITLFSTVLAYNFEVSTLQVGYQGIASTSLISSLRTSSLVTGGLLQTSETATIGTSFQTLSMLANTLSTQSLLVGSPLSVPLSTLIQIKSSVGVGLSPQDRSFTVDPLVYTIGDTTVEKTISTQQIFAGQVAGLFYGDGMFLRNVNYPERISSLILSTGSLVVEKTFFSSFLASSGTVTDVFTTYSTLKVGDLYVFGNSADLGTPACNAISASAGAPTRLLINTMTVLGDTADFVRKQVIVKETGPPFALTSDYTLEVKGSLRVQEYVSPNYQLEILNYFGDIVVAENVGDLKKTTLYLSSGILGVPDGTFFIPQSQTPLLASTNLVQPVLSTLVFNSTLFVSLDKQKVGINTQPTFEFDIASNVIVSGDVVSVRSTVIGAGLLLPPLQSSLTLAVTGQVGLSNLIFTGDGGSTWAPFLPAPPTSQSLYAIGFNGGGVSVTTSNTITSQRRWVVGGDGAEVYTYLEGTDSWTPCVFTKASAPYSTRGIAYNGSRWVLTGVNPIGYASQEYVPLHWSDDGIQWTPATTGGFVWDGVSSYSGGTSVAWNGQAWVAVGKGIAPGNTILTSLDGTVWRNAFTGGFSNEGRGLIWTGTQWVATGDNGSAVSSFLLSLDGSNWTPPGTAGFSSLGGFQGGSALATNGTTIVAVGTATPSSDSILTSQDGGTRWGPAAGTGFATEGRAIVWTGSNWIAGGADGIRVSQTGTTWSQPPFAPTSEIQALATSSNATPTGIIGTSNLISTTTSTLFAMNVACGTQPGTSNGLRWSQDGINWAPATSGFFRDEGRAAAYDGSNLWVAAGIGVASTFVYSTNAKDWYNCTLTSPVTAIAVGTGVAFSPQLQTWVATLYKNTGGGGESIWTSSNGLVWNGYTAFSEGGLGVAAGANTFVVVGEDTGGQTIQVPVTPTIWSGGSVTNAFSIKGSGIAYGASLWVACGQDAANRTLKYSGDTLNWSDATGVFGVAGFGVDYNGSNRWVAVGTGGGAVSNILYSGDGSNWSNVTSGAFTTSGRSVKYNQGLGLWMASGLEGVAGESLKYSGDGLNWSNGTGGFSVVGFGLAQTSGFISSTTFAVNQLRLYESPGVGVLDRDTTPSLAYTSTGLSLLTTLGIDRFKNVGIQTVASQTQSTFTVQGVTTVSSFVSTSAAQIGAYILGFSFA